MILNLLRITLAALIIFSSTNSLAVEDKIRTDISGYFEPQIMATKDAFLTKERLRLEIDIDFPHNVSLVTNADFFAYQGDRKWNMLDFVPEKINASVAAADFISLPGHLSSASSASIRILEFISFKSILISVFLIC